VSLHQNDLRPGVQPNTEEAVTGEDGRATFLREDVRSEEIVKSFRRNRRTFGLTPWAYTLAARDYEPVEMRWLPETKFENEGRNGKYFRLVFTVRMSRLPSHR
jgi:hypothetical protein